MAKDLSSTHVSVPADIDAKQASATGTAENWTAAEEAPTVATPRILTARGAGSRVQRVVHVTHDEATATPPVEAAAARVPLEVKSGSIAKKDNARTSCFTGAGPTVGEIRHAAGRTRRVAGRVEAHGSRKDDEDTRHCERVEKEIAGRFDVVTESMEKLSNVFSGAAEILATRIRAITTISRCAPAMWHHQVDGVRSVRTVGPSWCV